MNGEVFAQNKDDEQCIQISIPTDIYNRINNKIKGTGFENVSDFVTFVLRIIGDSTAHEPLSEEDEKKIKERLRSLGYID